MPNADRGPARPPVPPRGPGQPDGAGRSVGASPEPVTAEPTVAPTAGAVSDVGAFRDAVAATVSNVVTDVAAAIPPRLRGVLHGATFPVALLAGIVLVVFAQSGRAKVACAVYAGTAVLLFGVSALYHRWRWGARARELLQRLDHANIFLIIAGTYTPFALLVLPGTAGRAVLWAVWIGAAAGIVLRVCWRSAPRWLTVPIYIGLGWTAIFVLPQLWQRGGVAMTVLLLLGGLLYSLGGLVYGLRRPNPSPRVFGFHEVFHALTVAAFVVQYIAVSLAAYSAAAIRA